MMRSMMRSMQEANGYFKERYYRKAIGGYTEAIELNPKDKTFYSNRAAAYMKLNLYAEAAEDCESATKIDPKFAKVPTHTRIDSLKDRQTDRHTDVQHLRFHKQQHNRTKQTTTHT